MSPSPRSLRRTSGWHGGGTGSLAEAGSPHPRFARGRVRPFPPFQDPEGRDPVLPYAQVPDEPQADGVVAWADARDEAEDKDPEGRGLKGRCHPILSTLRFSRQVPVAHALLLPLLAHLDEDPEDLLDRDRIDLGLDGPVKGPVEDMLPLPGVPDGDPLPELQLGHITGELLPLGDEPDEPGIDLVDLLPDGLERHPGIIAGGRYTALERGVSEGNDSRKDFPKGRISEKRSFRR